MNTGFSPQRSISGVDLIIERKFGLIPFEIKYTQSVNLRHLRAIRDFVEEFDCNFGIVINNDEKVRLYDEKLLSLPFSLLNRETET